MRTRRGWEKRDSTHAQRCIYLYTFFIFSKQNHPTLSRKKAQTIDCLILPIFYLLVLTFYILYHHNTSTKLV